MDVEWTEYLKYRAALRGFDLERIEQIVKHSNERYVDMATNRQVVVGRCRETLVLVPYEVSERVLTPITIHATTRQQIEFRLKTGRFVHG
ncbi:MAG: hypothetical protein NTV79_00055 [Candidatus Aureabacteria bacterium]|jgi:hypothetical protein|nr:hypothetical protein [Candidatus Auribacterota bacterium]